MSELTLRVVLDTNVLVSALWTPAGNASAIVSLILSDKIIPFFDQSILDEYRAVLSRPRLAFAPGQVNELLDEIIGRGISLIVLPSTMVMPDESDRKFYDVAVFSRAYLITGNIRHFPEAPFVTNPARFLDMFRSFINN
jgi:putative PIN family toxin of toxin-antitoxin system